MAHVVTARFHISHSANCLKKRTKLSIFCLVQQEAIDDAQNKEVLKGIRGDIWRKYQYLVAYGWEICRKYQYLGSSDTNIYTERSQHFMD
jgi:hypothetical protein